MDFRKLSRYAFFSFLFLLPFQTVLLLRESFVDGEKWQYGAIGIYGTDILLILLIIFWFFSRQQRRHPEPARSDMRSISGRRSRGISELISEISRLADSLGMTEKTLFLLAAWSGLSIFWAADQMLAGYFFVKLCFAAGVFWIARSMNDSEARTAIKIILVAAILQGTLGVWQFLSQSSFASTLLGMSAYESWAAGTSVLKLESGRFLRAYGSFPHPNMIGGFLAVALVLLIADFRFQIADWKKNSAKYVIPSESANRGISFFRGLDPSRSLPAFSGLGMIIRKSLPFVGMLVILLGLILTFSRAAWLGFAIGIFVLLFISYRGIRAGHDDRMIASNRDIIRRPSDYVTILKVALVMGVAGVIFVFILRDQVFLRFDTGTIAREGSVSERVLSFADAKDLIVAHPIVGVGAGNFTVAVLENKGSSTFFSKENMYLTPRPVWSVQPAHNVFVLVLAELGVVGLVSFVLFIGSIFYGAILSVAKNPGIPRQARNDREEGFMLKNQNTLFAIALLTLLPSLLLDHSLWSSHFGLLFLFLLAGLSARK